MGNRYSRFTFKAKHLLLEQYQELLVKWHTRNGDDYVRPFVTSTTLPPSSGDIDYDLYQAASNDNHMHVEKLLKMGANGLAPQGDHDLTSLHVCMSAKCVARIVASFPRPIHRNLKALVDDRGNTPIHAAAQSNRVEALLCLVECGFDLAQTNNAGRTASRVAKTHTYHELSRLIDKLLTGSCWCNSDNGFDIEKYCQLYLQIYSYREACEDVFDFISNQKKEDQRDAFGLEKKLKPLLESQEERTRQANEKKQEEQHQIEQEGGPDFNTTLAKALKEMALFDKEQKRREAAERAGLEYVPKAARNDDSSDDEDGGGGGESGESGKSGESGGGGGSGSKKNIRSKESLKTRIKNLQTQIDTLTDATRWRVQNNSLGFPLDTQQAMNDVIQSSLALHVRLGCPTKEYRCQGCSKNVKVSNKETHDDKECTEALEECPQCKMNIKKRMLANHMKYVCLAREWVFCPNSDDQTGFGSTNCGKEMKSQDLRKHMKLECQFRKKKCLKCKQVVIFKDYKKHVKDECEDRCINCVVQGCSRTFHRTSEMEIIERHERKHLQKNIGLWTSGDVGFWLEKSFPFFGDFLMLNYKKKIIAHNVDGNTLKGYVQPQELRSKLFMKLIGMPEDHAYTVSEAIVGRTTPQDERWVEHPKVIRAGAYLSRDVKRNILAMQKEQRHNKYSVVLRKR